MTHRWLRRDTVVQQSSRKLELEIKPDQGSVEHHKAAVTFRRARAQLQLREEG
jgi:hypothetical protein